MDVTTASEIRVTRISQMILTVALIEQLMSQSLMTLDQANQVFNRAADQLLKVAPGLAHSEEEREDLTGLAETWRDYLLPKP